MGLDELQSGNTLRTKATAIAAFAKILKEEEVEEEYVRECIDSDESGKSFVCVMDRFGMYLAFNEGKGKPLARNTAMQYYRQAKLWLLDQFLKHRASFEARLLKMGKTLDNFCMKRDGGGLVSKATPCTKADLKKILLYLYTYACSESDYQDAALLCLLWYLLDRASDLAMVHKRNISVDASNVLFLRVVRVKTSEEQSYRSSQIPTSPHAAISLALMAQAAPCPVLVGNLPDQGTPTTATPSPDVSLIELLNAPPVTTGLAAPAAPPRVDTAPTIYAYVNRLLDRVVPATGVDAALTSHPFRRGRAQHANGCDEMTARWIFDWGSWNMSTTNKGFNYIFNTSKEDHKIAKVLSGHKSKAAVPLQDLSSFDAQTLDSIAEVQRVLFSTCYKLETESYNVNKKVLDVLTACVVRHFPLLKALNPGSPIVKRVEVAVRHAKCSQAELLAWSSHLARDPVPCQENQPSDKHPTSHDEKLREPSQKQKIIDHQASVIKHFIRHIKRQDARMDALEAKQPTTLYKHQTSEAVKTKTQKQSVLRNCSYPRSFTWLHARRPRDS